MKASTGASWRILPTSPACREVGAPSGSAGLAQASSQGESRAGLLIAVRVQPSPFASGTERASAAHSQVLTSILSSYGLSAGDFMFRTLVFDYREPAFGSYPVELILALPVARPVKAIGRVMDWLNAAGGAGRLRSIGPSTWESIGGLSYGLDKVFGNRVQHVLAHTVPDATKPLHSVFSVGRSEVLGLVDEAWARRGVHVPGDPGAFVVSMGRQVETAGETAIRLVVRPGTNQVITAHPVVP